MSNKNTMINISIWPKIKKKIKQCFCSHIYKVTDEEYLYTRTYKRRDYAVAEMTRSVQVTKYNYYALYKECVKCEKKIITETEHIVV